MDVSESEQVLQKNSAVETSRRRPLVLADKNNGATRPLRTREVSSRYRPSTPSTTRRSPSQNITPQTAGTSYPLVPKRALSAERRRPSTPQSPKNPSTPVHETSAAVLLESKKVVGNRSCEGLWPSTMRSLSVSFQPDTFSLPIGKREKPATHANSDRSLKPSSNVARKQAESPPISRKPTPERKRSPLKGKNAPDQLENSKPVGGLHARSVDQQRWPSRAGGNAPSKTSTRNVDLKDKTTKTSTLPLPGAGTTSLRRLFTSAGTSKPIEKAASDVASYDSGKLDIEACSVDNNPLLECKLQKYVSASTLEKMNLVTPAIRSQSLSATGSRPPSPNKSSVLSSVSRGVSPLRTRSLNPAPSRGVSPSRIRPASPSSRESNSSTSVLSFIADIRKGKKAAHYIEDAHQLRLLYNRNLQWRFANALEDAALHKQKVTAEKTLYNVWRTTSELWDSVTEKRIDLQQLSLEHKLNLVLHEQVAYLDDWALIERDHTHCLSRAIQDLRASTLRLPVTGGARADAESLKTAVFSAVNVMQAMGTSVCSVLSRVEDMNCLVSEVASVVAQERAMLDECETLLAATASMQVEEYSLRTHLIIQSKEGWRSGDHPILAIKTHP